MEAFFISYVHIYLFKSVLLVYYSSFTNRRNFTIRFWVVFQFICILECKCTITTIVINYQIINRWTQNSVPFKQGNLFISITWMRQTGALKRETTPFIRPERACLVSHTLAHRCDSQMGLSRKKIKRLGRKKRVYSLRRSLNGPSRLNTEEEVNLNLREKIGLLTDPYSYITEWGFM